MSQVKEAAIRLIESLPEDCTMEAIHYHLYVREKVNRGIQAVDEGRIIPQEEAERRIAQWAESTGQNRH